MATWSKHSDGSWYREDGVHLVRHEQETDAEYLWRAWWPHPGREVLEVEAPTASAALDEVDAVWPLQSG
jgi:hypothetical protein